jgi:hypothetical protein
VPYSLSTCRKASSGPDAQKQGRQKVDIVGGTYEKGCQKRGRFPLLAEITRSSISHPCTNDRVSPLTLPSPCWSEGNKSLACGVAKPCSQRRKQGAHCLSAASLRAAGFGEPRRAPEGPRHCQHGFGSFCRNKRTSTAWAKPGNIEHYMDFMAG